MRLLIDRNLSPAGVRGLQEDGSEALHWSTIGDPRATDAAIMDRARQGGYIVFTHDLDFSAILAATEAEGPSVIPARTQDVLPGAPGPAVPRVL